MTKYGEFCKWLEGRGLRLTDRQNEIAQIFFGLPERGGKSWLLDRLLEFERGGGRGK